MKPSGRWRKGTDGERELVRVLRAAGVRAERVPMSGALPFTPACDVIVLPRDSLKWQRWEVKRRRSLGIERWIAKADVLALRGDASPWLVCLPLAEYLRLVGPGTGQEAGKQAIPCGEDRG